MLNVCIYCGHNKALALEQCERCGRTPNTHKDMIHSIIACYSETEHYLNFLSLEDVETIRENIKTGGSLQVSEETFRRAEEAFSAVELNSGPKVIQYFSKITFPLTSVIVLTILAMIFI